jgi:hypothetical protein
MTTFDKREQGFEAKFAHDEEMAFRIKAKQAALTAQEVAVKAGLTPEKTDSYVRRITGLSVTSTSEGLIGQMFRDNVVFSAGKVAPFTLDGVRRQWNGFLAAARELAGANPAEPEPFRSTALRAASAAGSQPVGTA